jgi:hypothetical protein
MSEARRLRLIAACLDDEADDAAVRRRLAQESDWPALALQASGQMMSTSLHAGIARRDLAGALPGDFADYLGALFELNAERNGNIRVQLAEVAAALNHQGIEPVLLKGAAALLSDLYGDAGSRLIGDLDLLVAPDELPRASAALQALGYQRVLEGICDERHYGEFHHDAPLVHPDRVASVELHRRYLLSARGTRLMDAIARPPVAIRIGEASARLPQATERLAHNFLHQMVQDSGFVRGSFDLRQLYEAALLVRRYRADIHWRALLAAIDGASCTHEWGAFAASLRSLFGVEVPAGSSGWVQPRLWLARAHLQYRWPWLRQLNQRLYRHLHRVLPQSLRNRLGWDDYGWFR